ncbi:MAG TPA: glycosyltransferase family 39 protein, partial [Dongiaceae bacterium]|nr:glycosyltransferase family 39 protein [Dongiaceae bacterium]
MTSTARIWVLLFLVIAFGFALRSYKALQIDNFPHDDQISYLAAAGQLDDYVRFMPQDGELRIAPASTWQAFTQAPASESTLDAARTISQSLLEQDIHPPLYFIWLRGVVSLLPDITLITGWISNLLFFFASALLLFLIARRLLRNRAAAVIATGVWCCGVAAIETSLVARHYEILTFFTLASTAYLLWLLDTNRFGLFTLLGYGVLACLGFLANYQFLYHLGALSLVILLAEYRRPLRVLAFALVTLAALGLALYLYPALLKQSAEVAGWSPPATSDDVLFRIKNTLEEVLKFCVMGSLALIYVAVRRRDLLRQPDRRLWVLLGI